MKILILADASASHIINWVNSISDRNYAIDVFSFTKADINNYRDNVNIISCDIAKSRTNKKGINFTKFIYVLKLNKLKKIINKNGYDIIHAHYATSYGFLLSLIKHNNKILSVWGSDVYTFPKTSIFHKLLLKHNLNNANILLSTSNAMKVEIKKYTQKKIQVTPFGIDVNKFSPIKNPKVFNFKPNTKVIGTIKFIDELYGTDYLIESFNLLKNRNPRMDLRLIIVGGYIDTNYYNNILQQISNSKYKNDIILTGMVEYKNIVSYYNSLNVFIALSRQESFGVSALEAQSCGIPVVVSNVGGLPEVVCDGITGYVVEKGNIKDAVISIEKLLFHQDANEMSIKCRDFVLSNYNWEDCVTKMVNVYDEATSNI